MKNRPLWLATAATVFGVVLATVPAIAGPVRYDPTLGVLTATLIAIIWYTYFAYLLVDTARAEGERRDQEAQLIRTQLAYMAKTLDIAAAEEIASLVVVSGAASEMLSFIRTNGPGKGNFGQQQQRVRYLERLERAANATKGRLSAAAARAAEAARASIDSPDQAEAALEEFLRKSKAITNREAAADLVLPALGTRSPE